MIKLGYKLMSEEHGPKDLVRNLVRAEQAGFDLAAISDHFSPWVEEQGHAPLAWSVLGALAQATTRIGLMTAVTCPIMRYHPAIIAQGAATIALLSDGRFTLGLGAGERLNEHVAGQGWPGVGERHERLSEAIDIIQGLLSGELPAFNGAQALGCSPVATAFAAGTDVCRPVKPDTIVRSLAIGNPADGPYAVELARATEGGIDSVTDDEIRAGIRLLAETTGIFTETAGGVTTAVLAKLAERGDMAATSAWSPTSPATA